MGRSAAALLLAALTSPLDAQALLTGRLVGERWPGAGEDVPFTGVYAFASLPGAASESLSFRTWETEPAGWYRLSGPAGAYTVLFTNPAGHVRPTVLTNVLLRPGDAVERLVRPAFDFACFHEKDWDREAASAYVQPFVARGASVTSVGFKLATDGVDGAGPGSQSFVVSVHEQGDGPPDSWRQVGPAAVVPGVDCGGPKSYAYSAGWASGQVPTRPDGAYAVKLRAEAPGGKTQAFWRVLPEGAPGCWRAGPSGSGFTGHEIWLAVASDADGLVAPYAKRVHRQFAGLTKIARTWSQTYVAAGRGLAGVVLYAAVSGKQPGLGRQRARVRVRRGGADRPVVGAEKIAVGWGNYTGDASWGVFGAAFAPGEVPLEPGATYAIELESIETYETLHGFVNIKGEVSDDRAGFNPYRKAPGDDYEHGTAYLDGKTPMDFDLDMEVVEYAHAPAGAWEHAVDPAELLRGGDMDEAAGWKTFSLAAGTSFEHAVEQPERRNRFARVTPSGADVKAIDGGYVRRVEGLIRGETYRVLARVRPSYPIDVEHECLVGVDPTGQEEDAGAASIEWRPAVGPHGVWSAIESEAVRPGVSSLSVWLRVRGKAGGKPPFGAVFRGDFDDVSVRRVSTGAPRGGE